MIRELGSLTEADIEAAFRVVVKDWVLDRLDTQLGTGEAVQWLRSWGTSMGSVSSCEDGPYGEWSRWVNVDARGAHVEVKHHDEVVRAGRLPWNLIANRATLRACERRHQRDLEATADYQPPLF